MMEHTSCNLVLETSGEKEVASLTLTQSHTESHGIFFVGISCSLEHNNVVLFEGRAPIERDNAKSPSH